MIKNIYSNIEDTDALESFFECLVTALLTAGVLNVRRYATQNI